MRGMGEDTVDFVDIMDTVDTVDTVDAVDAVDAVARLGGRLSSGHSESQPIIV